MCSPVNPATPARCRCNRGRVFGAAFCDVADRRRSGDPVKLPLGSLPDRRAPTGQWHAGGVSTTAPASTYILVIGIMATFWAFGIVLIFTPPWYYFMIPVALAIPELVILYRRWQARARMRRELQAAMEELS